MIVYGSHGEAIDRAPQETKMSFTQFQRNQRRTKGSTIFVADHV